MPHPVHRLVPIGAPAEASGTTSCAAAEPYALMVLGDAMRPEFEHGDIVIVEPDGLAQEGSFVIAHCNGEWMLRALRSDPRGWRLVALDAGHAPVVLPDLGAVAGVVIQKAKPGRRRATKRYVD